MKPIADLWIQDPVFASITAAAAAAAALCLFAISVWFALLVRRSEIPYDGAFAAFTACLGSTGATVAAGVLTSWNSAHPALAAASLLAAASSTWSAALLLPRLGRVVRAIRGLYLSETRRRMLEDYSEELRALNQLREREAKDFEAIASSSSDQIFRLAPDGAIEYASPAASAFFGIAKGTLRGGSLSRLALEPEAARSVEEARAKVLASGREERGSLSLRGRHFDFLCSPILENTRVIALTLNFRDVTDRRSFELELVKAYSEMENRVRERTEELSASRQSFQDLVHTIDGIVWESEVGKPGFSFVSGQAGRITGHTSDRWLSEKKFWQKILHPEDLARITGDRYVHPDQKKDLQTEYRIITADGRVRWMRDHIKVIFEGGRAVKMRGIMVDVTEQKKAALQQENEISQRAGMSSPARDLIAPPNREEGAISLEALRQLEQRNAPGKSDIVLELAAQFLGTAQSEAGKILEAAEQQELDQLQRAAQSFRRSCHNIGARRLAKVCGALEELRDIASSELLLRRLERETTFALTELSAFVSRRKAS